MDDILREFLVESHESLDQLDRDLVSLEEDPANRDTISSIFRTMHTIKGTSGFLAFNKLEKLTHVAENLLSQLRDGAITVNAEITSSLLATTDAVRGMLASVESNGTDGDDEYGDLVRRLTLLNDNGGVLPAGSAPPPPKAAGKAAGKAAAKAKPAEPRVEAPPAAIAQEPPAPPVAQASEPDEEDVPATATAKESDTEPEPTAKILGPAATADDHATEAGGGQVSAPQRTSALTESSIRVDVELLDKLMNLVGELVLARNQILQFSAHLDDSQFIQTSQRLNLITTELQEGVMKTRMQPIGNVWSKFPRVVRDLAIACKKKVRIEMVGKETDLDRTLLEAIKDPLTHIVRNSVDHGIEAPDVRRAAGKNEEGCLHLRAYHEGGQVNLEISDDGGGIDPERIRNKALEKGLITKEQAARMGERETLNLIFKPGLSTAQKVTNISGRGVGMDVVKSNIEKIGGTVDIQSKLGEGTTLKIKIPLTLAIIPALTVMCGGDRYAIPQVSLVELVRLEGEVAEKGIENIHGSLVHRLRGNLLPLVFLNDELGLNAVPTTVETAIGANREVNIVVLQADGRQFGLVVDKIHDTEEIVVKPLGRHLKNISIFAGTTIMGDGKVALILDVLGIAQKASIISEEMHDAQVGSSAAESASCEETRTLLLFTSSRGGRMALPLSQVARLEEFDRDTVESAGDFEVVQYRGEIMPLLDISDALPDHYSHEAQQDERARADSTLQVVVHTVGGRSVGVKVGRILDIIQESVEVRREATRDGVIETAVVQGRVTEIVDIDSVIHRMCANLFEHEALAGAGA